MDPGRRVSGQGFCSHAHLGPEAQPLWDPPQGSGAGGGQTKSNRDKTETERSDHRGRPGGGRQQMRRGREKSAGRMCAGQRGRLCRRHRGRGRLGRAPSPGESVLVLRGQVSHLRKHWLPTHRSSRREGEQRGTHCKRGTEGRGGARRAAGAGRRLQATGVWGVREGGGEGAWAPCRFSEELEKGVARTREKEEQEEADHTRIT